MLASGVTAIAGFGVLALSDIRMLRDFGIVTVVDLTVSLLGVLLVLPAVLVLVERGAPQRLLARLRRPSPAGRDGAGRRLARRMRGWGASWIAVAAGMRDPRSTSPTTRSRRRVRGRAGSTPAPGMPPFAAPLVTSDLEGDANVARHADQGAAGARRRPAT